MNVCIELCLAANFLMDTFIFVIAMRGRRRIGLRRLLIAGTFSTACMLMFRSSKAFHLAVLFVSTVLLTGKHNIKDTFKDFFAIIACSFLTGSSILLINSMLYSGRNTPSTPAVILGCCFTAFVMKRRRTDAAAIEIQVTVAVGSRTCKFRALIDTGNRLHEPISALPVLIVSKHILPEDFDTTLTHRSVYYGALGGTGMLKCFFPSAVYIGSGAEIRPGPDVWIAVYPLKIPGKVQALAPVCMYNNDY